ncbi:hypothetical protein Tco_0729379 [Tanacetum coccineum]|uniref:Uncharacterized protein n=1 Tax=Tanacetum coccineum TaxID=301880 RepID=A0ABQ4YNT6_9ASTR
MFKVKERMITVGHQILNQEYLLHVHAQFNSDADIRQDSDHYMFGDYFALMVTVLVNKYAFSGGKASIEDHRKYGADLEDDDELERIGKEYGSGRMLTGDIKKRLVQVLSELVERHQAAWALVTDEMVDAFMAVRPLPNMFQ